MAIAAEINGRDRLGRTCCFAILLSTSMYRIWRAIGLLYIGLYFTGIWALRTLLRTGDVNVADITQSFVASTFRH